MTSRRFLDSSGPSHEDSEDESRPFPAHDRHAPIRLPRFYSAPLDPVAHELGRRRHFQEVTTIYRSNRTTVLATIHNNGIHNKRCDICFHADTCRLRLCLVCDAVACQRCLRLWLQTKIEDGDVGQITCFTCDTPIPDNELKSIVGDVYYKRYIFLRSKIDHARDPSAAWCPRYGCWNLLQCNVRKQSTHALEDLECSECKTKVCAQCFNESHGEDSCPVPNSAMRENTLSRLWQKVHTKKCPVCKVRIERSGGCSLMRCSNCHTRFCWKCKGLVNVDEEPPNTTRRLAHHPCICTKLDNAFMWFCVTGGVVLAVPVLVVGAVIFVPPALITYATLPKEKKRQVRADVSELFHGT